MFFRACLTFALALSCAAAATAQQRAEGDWPNRHIKFIVPFPAGASTDVVARIVTRRLAERIGASIVIENKAGASGDAGSDVVAKSRPDGYTLGLATTSTHAIAASLKIGRAHV